jgi:Helix-turn-helix domain
VGRNETPVDPSQGSLQRFAHELQLLRRRAGEPTYRSMSRAVGLSPSVLSQASKGGKLPTLQTTLAFVRACGTDPATEQDWQRAWERVRAEIAHTGTAPDERGPSAEPGRETGRERDRDDTTGFAPRSARRWNQHRVISALLGLIVIMAAIIGALIVHMMSGTATPRVLPIADGLDPYVQGCGRDQKPMDRQPIYLSNGTRYGWIVLFVSTSCSGAWGYVLGPNSPHWRVHISAYRPEDKAEARFSFQGSAAPNSWGNALSTDPGCVRAEAWIDNGPRAMTTCWSPGNRITHEP